MDLSPLCWEDIDDMSIRYSVYYYVSKLCWEDINNMNVLYDHSTTYITMFQSYTYEP